jgi:hypothetical protein
MPEKTSFSLARMEHGQVGSSKFGAFSVLSLLSLSLSLSLFRKRERLVKRDLVFTEQCM